MAPMLGITDSCFRQAYTESFGGFDCAISPFIKTLKGERFIQSKFKDLDPSLNRKLRTYPQILSNCSEDFIHLANSLFDLGYPIVNLNMGCPVPTSAGRRRGAGLLAEVDFVDQFLDEVLSKTSAKLSIKTRIGFEHEDDLLKMIKVFNQYPLHEVIIHPRTAKQKYSGLVNHERFEQACQELNHQIVYSGDLFRVNDFLKAQDRYPYIRKWMFGRGILQDPGLISKIHGYVLARGQVLDFYYNLSEHYREKKLSEHIILSRLKTLIFYYCSYHQTPKKTVKLLRKSKKMQEFMEILPQIESA